MPSYHNCDDDISARVIDKATRASALLMETVVLAPPVEHDFSRQGHLEERLAGNIPGPAEGRKLRKVRWWCVDRSLRRCREHAFVP